MPGIFLTQGDDHVANGTLETYAFVAQGGFQSCQHRLDLGPGCAP